MFNQVFHYQASSFMKEGEAYKIRLNDWEFMFVMSFTDADKLKREYPETIINYVSYNHDLYAKAKRGWKWWKEVKKLYRDCLSAWRKSTWMPIPKPQKEVKYNHRLALLWGYKTVMRNDRNFAHLASLA